MVSGVYELIPIPAFEADKYVRSIPLYLMQLQAEYTYRMRCVNQAKFDTTPAKEVQHSWMTNESRTNYHQYT